MTEEFITHAEAVRIMRQIRWLVRVGIAVEVLALGVLIWQRAYAALSGLTMGLGGLFFAWFVLRLGQFRPNTLGYFARTGHWHVDDAPNLRDPET